MDEILQKLVVRLQKAYGASLRSVIVYGSAAQPAEHDADYSDINILCVLSEITPVQLASSGAVFAWWQAREMPAPLLLSEREIAAAADCFAIEFRDMQRRRRVLHGDDLLDGIRVGESFYRLQVEYELRSKLLRLRQKAAAVFADKKLTRRLLVDSVTTFCVLLRHALMLHGWEVPPGRRAVISEASSRLGIDSKPFYQLLDVREKRAKPGSIEPTGLLGDYLKQIEKIIDSVNALEKPSAASAGGEI